MSINAACTYSRLRGSLSLARRSAGKNEKNTEFESQVARAGNPRLHFLRGRLNFFFSFSLRIFEQKRDCSVYTYSFLKEREANCSLVNKTLCMSLTSSLLIYLKDSECCSKFRQICIITGLRIVPKRLTLHLTSRAFLTFASLVFRER